MAKKVIKQKKRPASPDTLAEPASFEDHPDDTKPHIEITGNNLRDKAWRMNHLYTITDKEGDRVLFKMNRVQEAFFDELWYMSICLKARQQGFCLDPQTRVLTADLRWVKIKNLLPGTEIVSVDENPPGEHGKGRKMRTGVVQGVCFVEREAYRVVFDDGCSVICTGAHPWLSKKTQTQGVWRTIDSDTKKKLRVGFQVRWVTKPWDSAGVEDGWYGGMLDGEGSLAKPSRSGASVNVSQVLGPVFDRAEKYLGSRGYHYRVEKDRRKAKAAGRVVVTRMDEMFRLIGQTRPTRFIGKHWWDGKELPGKRNGGVGWSTITSIEPLGKRPMVDLQTSLGTYIAEGFVSHNTTFIDLYILDECLFNSDIEAGIIAHTRQDAMEIFRRKIRFPYDNLDDRIKSERPLLKASQSQLQFDNNSLISVGTSMRSATLQYLHISELGKIAKKYPEKAREIMTGALESVAQGDTMIFVESTGEGRSGVYYELCDKAQKLQQADKEPTRLEFKFNFFPWFDCPDYELDDPVSIPKEMQKYFAEVESKTGTTLSQEQKAWYIVKRRLLGDDIKREYPSTAEEAFASGIQGTYFKTQFIKIRQDGRICSVPHYDGIVVDSWWDLGMDDSTSIFFTQDIGREVHILNFYENSGEGLAFYRGIMDDFAKKYGYKYGRIVAPHDIKVRELATGISRLESAHKMGLNMEVAPRVEHKMDAIEQARSLLGVCWFDEINCDTAVEHLEEYRKEWDDVHGVFRDKPLHDKHSHCADAFQNLAVSHSFRPAGVAVGGRRKAKRVIVRNSKGWT